MKRALSVLTACIFLLLTANTLAREPFDKNQLVGKWSSSNDTYEDEKTITTFEIFPNFRYRSVEVNKKTLVQDDGTAELRGAQLHWRYTTSTFSLLQVDKPPQVIEEKWVNNLLYLDKEFIVFRTVMNGKARVCTFQRSEQDATSSP